MINNSSIRATVIQALVIIILVCAGYYLFSNVVENLRQMELPFGFGFVNSTAGFDVSWSLIPYDPSMSYGRVYLVGIVNTLLLSALIIAFSTLRGFIVSHFNHLAADFRRDMENWVTSGQITYKETIYDGIDKAPDAFIGLFTGANTGKMVVNF